MFSVLIVDDEPEICELTKNLIDWEGLELSLSGCAFNGKDAFNMIMEKNPDIVITDVRMPGTTGLDLIKNVKVITPETLFIVISGYSEFEYAQSALKHGAEDYLLKPINQIELNELLKKVCDKKNHIISKEENIRQLDNMLTDTKSVVRKNSLFHLLFDSNTTDYGFKTEGLSFFNFKSGNYFVMELKADYIDAFISDNTVLTALLQNCSEKICHSLKYKCYDSEFVCIDTTAYFIVNYSPDSHSTLTELKKSVNQTIKSYLYKYDSYEITIGIGCIISTLDDIPQSLNSATIALHNRVAVGTGIIIDYNTLPETNRNSDIKLDKEVKLKIRDIVMALDTENLLRLIDQLFYEYLFTKNDRFKIYKLSETLIQIIIDSLRGMGLYKNINTQKILGTINNSSLFEVVKKNLKTAAVNLLETYNNSKTDHYSKPVVTAKKFIEQHYKEPITLEDIAKEVFLNPVYLGALFKQETGETFSSFLINTRMDAAKQLLESTYLSVNEISSMVGYSNAKYFSQLFRKIVGVKPSEYRKIHS